MAAQAEVEDHDIAEMLKGQAALRRKTGRPSLADELIDEALRDDPDDQSTT